MPLFVNNGVLHACRACLFGEVGEAFKGYRRLPNGRRKKCTFCPTRTRRRFIRVRLMVLSDYRDGVYGDRCSACGENFLKGEVIVRVKPYMLWHVACVEGGRGD